MRAPSQRESAFQAEDIHRLVPVPLEEYCVEMIPYSARLPPLETCPLRCRRANARFSFLLALTI